MSKELLEEIMSQRALTYAENGELQPNFAIVSTSHILEETVAYLSHHTVSFDKTVLISEDVFNTIISTDEVLLKRVLINMLKNALEASPKEAVILLNCKDDDDFVCFTVHNQGFMSAETQAQVFQRSFSTRGADRGFGTYSIKLLTTRYLKGTAGFTTSIKEGTEFFVKIPFH
jgi:signal transduction histidine kinase